MSRDFLNWFVIQTNPQSERKAAAELRRAGIRVYMPKKRIETKHARTKAPEIKRRPVLIGYLFVRFPKERADSRGTPFFATARACQGVKDFVRAINERDEWEPWPLPNGVVMAMMRRERNHEYDDEQLQAWWKAERKARFAALVAPGAHVLVKVGPFAAFEAIVEGLNSNNSVRALIDVLGRATAVTFEDPERQLEPLAKLDAA